MGMKIRETYVNETEGHQFGNSEWYEPWTDDRGKLFRALQREYGRCLSRMYVDRKVAQPQLAAGPMFRRPERWETVPIGWVFSKRMAYEDARGDPYTGKLRPSDYYTREVWVEIDPDASGE